MHPDWQTIHRLMLGYRYEPGNDQENNQEIEALIPVIHGLSHGLPEARITLVLFDCDRIVISPLLNISKILPNIQIISIPTGHDEQTIEQLRHYSFDAAILFTVPGRSPYRMGYLCYLAGIPIRLGQSKEFGGGVLSPCITPPLENGSLVEYYLHLLRSSGFCIDLEMHPSHPNPQNYAATNSNLACSR